MQQTISRGGEASNPGPVGQPNLSSWITDGSHTEKWATENGFLLHTIVGDGACLYHALGKMIKERQAAVRNIIMQGAPAVWTSIVEHDMQCDELQQFIG